MSELIAACGLIALVVGAAGCGGSGPAASPATAAAAGATGGARVTTTAQAAPSDFGLTRTVDRSHATEPEAGVAGSSDESGSGSEADGRATAASGSGAEAEGDAPAPSASTAATGGARKPKRVPKPRVTFVGDSVPDAINFDSHARTILARGTRSLQLNLKVCRRLWTTSCPYQGVTPSTALDAVRAYGGRLGDVLIVDGGYNDDGSTYGDGMRAVINTANRAGVKGIVWVNLRESRSYYRTINSIIGSVARRSPNVVVANWNAESAGKPWFGSDGLHLNNAGAEHLASFLRPYVQMAAGSA